MQISLKTKIHFNEKETEIEISKKDLLFRNIDIEDDNIIIETNERDYIIISLLEICTINDKVLETNHFIGKVN